MVEIPDVAPVGFRAMLRYLGIRFLPVVLIVFTPSRYICTGEADITEDTFESVVKVSDKYLLTGLFTKCVGWLKGNVTTANVYRFLPLADLCSGREVN